MNNETTQAEITVPVQGTTKIGVDQLSNPTPKAVTYFVRGLLWLTGTWGMVILTTDPKVLFGLTDAQALRVCVAGTVLTAAASGLARFTGVDNGQKN